jgi:hypothetical protein
MLKSPVLMLVLFQVPVRRFKRLRLSAPLET